MIFHTQIEILSNSPPTKRITGHKTAPGRVGVKRAFYTKIKILSSTNYWNHDNKTSEASVLRLSQDSSTCMEVVSLT